jgi:DNA polymerase-3 subunit gamma/tau
MTENTHYTVTARKWRPLRFDDVVGQGHITRTLKNSIKTGRIHHGAIFTGSRGVGKTTTARIFARALNCPNALELDYEPCNECEQCRSILSGSSLNVLEIDGASNNSVDDIRNLRESAKYAPPNKGYKVYIIDEVHMLSTAAFNALLKLLEEPPEHLIFIFATTEPHKIPATIISRTQRYDFRRMDIPDIVSQLTMIAEKESIKASEKVLMAIAKKGDGSMRDSQSIFDQVVAFCGKDIDYEDMKRSLYLIDDAYYFMLEGYIYESDKKGIFTAVKDIVESGYDISEALHGLIEHYRNIYTVMVTGSTDMIISDAATLQNYRSKAETYSNEYILSVLGRLVKMELELKSSSIPRHRFEMGLLSISSIPSELDLASILSGSAITESGKKKTEESNSEISQLNKKRALINPEPQSDKPAGQQTKKPIEDHQASSPPDNLEPKGQAQKATPATATISTTNVDDLSPISKPQLSTPKQESSENSVIDKVSSASDISTPDKVTDNQNNEKTDSNTNSEEPGKIIDRVMKDLFNAERIK